MEKKSRELLAPHVEEELMDYILHTPVKIGEKLPNLSWQNCLVLGGVRYVKL